MAVMSTFKALFKSPDAAGAVKSAPGKTPAVVAGSHTKRDTSGLSLKRLQTEKAVAGEAQGTYVFLVSAEATKPGVASAFRALTAVTPSAVRMLRLAPASGVRFSSRRRQKKAMVTVPKGATVKFPPSADNRRSVSESHQ